MVAPAQEGTPIAPASPEEPGDGIITTEAEMAIFDHARTRIAFLVRDETLFNRLKDLQWVDFKTRFVVFYKQARKDG